MDNYLLKGQTLCQGKYRIMEVLGHGGFGNTYVAEQTSLGRKVALKEFFIRKICQRASDGLYVTVAEGNDHKLWEGFRGKFIKEARTIASLSHTGIVSVYDVFEENGTAYYSMEYIDGISLQNYVVNVGGLTQQQSVNIIRAVGDALYYIHRHNILHLDVKPDNIMLRDSGEPVLIDFGVSKHYDDNGHQTTTLPVGRSCGYAPGEQYVEGGLVHFSPSTDIYSLAATLYFMLAGERPPEPAEIIEEGLPSIGGVKAQIMNAVFQGMSQRRSDRPQTVPDFLAMLPTAYVNNGDDISVIAADVHENDLASSAVTDLGIMRNLIEQLEREGSLKAAYKECINHVRLGQDVEYCTQKASMLASRLKKQNKKNSMRMYIVVGIVTLLSLLLSLAAAFAG